jgi:uncharacterized protein with PQ loop repeat
MFYKYNYRGLLYLCLMAHHLYRHMTKKQRRTMVDHLMSVAAIAHPLTALPQVYSIYTTRNVSGISLVTWLGFMLLGLVFWAYSIIHRIKPFIVTQTLWFIVDLLVVIGILLYR